MARPSLASLPFWPRGLSRDQAAAYCGVSAGLLDAIPVQPRKIRGRLVWDRVELDAWFDATGNRKDLMPGAEAVLAAWDAADDL